jgi:hypothetical protein
MTRKSFVSFFDDQINCRKRHWNIGLILCLTTVKNCRSTTFYLSYRYRGIGIEDSDLRYRSFWLSIWENKSRTQDDKNRFYWRTSILEKHEHPVQVQVHRESKKIFSSTGAYIVILIVSNRIVNDFFFIQYIFPWRFGCQLKIDSNRLWICATIVSDSILISCTFKRFKDLPTVAYSFIVLI